MKKPIFVLLYLVAFALLTSCGKPSVYQEYQSIPKLLWDRTKPLNFKMHLKDNQKDYKMSVALRFHSEMEHKSIKLGFKLTAPSGKVENTKMYEIVIRNEKGIDGSVMGQIADVKKVVEENIKFAENGDYKIEITQMMNNISTLNGIQEVGVILEDKEK
jgi:gliding motility-associated lipoprotein GldH